MSDKIIERVRNVKTDNRKEGEAGDYSSFNPPIKRQEKVQDADLMQRYPIRRIPREGVKEF